MKVLHHRILGPVGFSSDTALRFTGFSKLLHYRTTIAPQKSCEKPVNRRAASDEKPTPELNMITDEVSGLAEPCALCTQSRVYDTG